MTVIYVSDPVHDDVLTELREIGEVHLGYGPTAVTYQQIQHTVDAVLLRGEVFDREKITNSPQLKIIARHGVGHDNVDLNAASDADVWVTTTRAATAAPSPNTSSPSPSPSHARSRPLPDGPAPAPGRRARPN